MLRRNVLAATIGLGAVCLFAGTGTSHAQQSEAEKVQAAIDGFHAAIGALDIKKMDEVWVHEPYAVVVNPRDKSITVGFDAIRKNFEDGVFKFWSELKVTPTGAPHIHVSGSTAWATGVAFVVGTPKAGGAPISSPTFESAVLEKRGDRWLVASWSAWRVPQ
jgi:ketosteroid isomerase-like protein